MRGTRTRFPGDDVRLFGERRRSRGLERAYRRDAAADGRRDPGKMPSHRPSRTLLDSGEESVSTGGPSSAVCGERAVSPSRSSLSVASGSISTDTHIHVIGYRGLARPCLERNVCSAVNAETDTPAGTLRPRYRRRPRFRSGRGRLTPSVRDPSSSRVSSIDAKRGRTYLVEIPLIFSASDHGAK